MKNKKEKQENKEFGKNFTQKDWADRFLKLQVDEKSLDAWILQNFENFQEEKILQFSKYDLKALAYFMREHKNIKRKYKQMVDFYLENRLWLLKLKTEDREDILQDEIKERQQKENEQKSVFRKTMGEFLK